jgi:acetolactate synthase-1/3 small subunit
VLAVFGYLDDEIVFNEIALFKIATPLQGESIDVKTINLDWNAKVVHWGLEYVVVEKNGTEDEIHEFYTYLKKWEILEYIKSGRVAVGKTEKGLVAYLPEEGNWEIV